MTRIRRGAVALALMLACGCMRAGLSDDDGPPPARLKPLPEDFSVRDARAYSSFQTALRNGQLDFADRHGITLPAGPRALVDGLALVLAGENDRALPFFQDLLSRTEEANLRSVVRTLVANLLYESGRHDALSLMLGDAEDPGAQLVHVLAVLPPQSIEPGGETWSRLDVGEKGHPAVQVSANGREDAWFFDTGASQSVVAASVAEELGIAPVGPEIAGLATATSITRPARVGLLRELALGGVVARDVAVLIYDDEDLLIPREGGGSTLIRGVVGWPIIRELRVELDYAAGSYVAELSEPARSAESNFSWMGYPIVRLASEEGQPLLFGLDTGSWNTSIAENIFEKVAFASVRDDVVDIGGVGGMVSTEVKVVDRLGLALGGVHVDLSNVQTESESGANDIVFFAADGVLGSDVAQGARLLLDYRNGWLELSPGR